MIRNATLADMPQMLANARTFIDASPYKGLCDDESMRHAFIQMMEDGLLLVDAEEDGAHLGGIGAVKVPLFFNEKIHIAIERFWWVKPGNRAMGIGKGLFDAHRIVCKEAGCKKRIMISLNDAQVDAFYKASGMTEVEHCFVEDL